MYVWPTKAKLLNQQFDFQLHKHYTPQKKAENSHFSELKSNFGLQDFFATFTKKNWYHLKEGLDKKLMKFEF